ncbi:MAG: RidA family protein [Saprospiraceae bacterium]
MIKYLNPFPLDPDRHAIWEMLVERDIRAFVTADWDRVAGDFIPEGFIGVDARKHPNPDFWELTYPTLDDYREEWLRQAQEFAGTTWQEDPEEAIYRATRLRDIEIHGEVAIAHKKFDGSILAASGAHTLLRWQTLYRCRKVEGDWKIAGFTGYLPFGNQSLGSPAPRIRVPDGASQHKTAGPYSPVLEIQAGKLVVLSGQAAIDQEGNIVGDTIEEQTHYTLKNCQQQLEAAGVSLDQVFKVNVYLSDLNLWPRFNAIYQEYFSDPKPVRATVGTQLLMTLLVEIEMWAVKA